MAGSLRPLVLVRGFGGTDVGDEQASPYQGFNDGTVYPGRRGDNYIYEGFVLRALKSDGYPYRDATNVVGYYGSDMPAPKDLADLDVDSASGTVVLDPGTAMRVLGSGTAGTVWVYRYYDLAPRSLERYGQGLARLVELIERAADRHGEEFRGVDIVAHSMGGLVVREGLKALHTHEEGSARRLVHRVVTLGTPHRGISFQRAPSWLLRILPGVEKAGREMESFNPSSVRFLEWSQFYDVDRVLTVVGTNYRSYGTAAASVANRVTNLFDDGSLVYNRSDGLVMQASAQLPGAPRTFVHKCHGGRDSLVTSREAYEIAMRFFHGTHQVRLSLDSADISRGGDWFGRSEFYLGVSIKPRYVDFELFHQSVEAENCYGPFREPTLSDELPVLADELAKPLAEFGDRTTGWAGPQRMIWQGWIDAASSPPDAQGMVFRLDLNIGERDTFGVGFSDNVVFRKQYYVQVFPGNPIEMYVHTGEQYLTDDPGNSQDQLRAKAGTGPTAEVQRASPDPGHPGQWTFTVAGTGFTGTFRVGISAASP